MGFGQNPAVSENPDTKNEALPLPSLVIPHFMSV